MAPQARSHFVVQDYLNVVGMEENAYDAAFYMESSLHTEARATTFAQASPRARSRRVVVVVVGCRHAGAC